jgi:hypothetical protein
MNYEFKWNKLHILLQTRTATDGIVQNTSCLLCRQYSIYCSKYLRECTYKEERFSLAHSFGGFSPWSAGSVAFGPEKRHTIMAGGAR